MGKRARQSKIKEKGIKKTKTHPSDFLHVQLEPDDTTSTYQFRFKLTEFLSKKRKREYFIVAE